MTVYVVTKGDYSDYHICGVTLDPKKADILKQKFSDRDDEANVEEYDTDEFEFVRKDHNYYHITFDETGNIRSLYNIDPIKENNYGYNRYNNQVFVDVIAKDEPSAIKIAAEKRAKCLAEQFGL